eukprot:705691-Pelagomonas_calceolata.AAC.1
MEELSPFKTHAPPSQHSNTRMSIASHTFLVLDLALHIVDGVAALHLQGDGLAGQSFHEDLQSAWKEERSIHKREEFTRERRMYVAWK